MTKKQKSPTHKKGIEWEEVSITIDQLRPYENNPRKISKKDYDRLVRDIRSNGYHQRIIATHDYRVIGGHQRIKALKELGMKQIRVLVPNQKISEEKFKEILVKDNLPFGEFDFDMLEEHFPIDELMDWGMPEAWLKEEMDSIRKGNTDPDEIPETPAKPICKSGDVWILGNHKLICGDSTAPKTFEKLMEDQRVRMTFTDPPYNVNYKAKAGKIQNDNLEDKKFFKLLAAAFNNAYGYMLEGAPIYITHADTEGLNFRKAFKECGFKLSGCLIWEKPSLVLGRSDYQWRHEPILYGWKPGKSHFWYGKRNKNTVINTDESPVRQSDDGMVQVDIDGGTVFIRGDNLKVEMAQNSLIKVDKPKVSKEHPTMKPTALINRFLLNSTKEGDIVLDMFGGSGSTLLSCEMTGRSARLVELDPKFCDVIINRWQDYTAKKAIHAESGRAFGED